MICVLAFIFKDPKYMSKSCVYQQYHKLLRLKCIDWVFVKLCMKEILNIRCLMKGVVLWLHFSFHSWVL